MAADGLRLARGHLRPARALRLQILHGTRPLAGHQARSRSQAGRVDHGDDGRGSAGECRKDRFARGESHRRRLLRCRHQGIEQSMLRHGSQRQSQRRQRERGRRAEGCVVSRDHGRIPAPHTGAKAGHRTMTARWTIRAFSGYGIELEYVIVDRETLAVRPIAGELLRLFGGQDVCAVQRGQLGWSNELVAHVVELKNIAPAPALEMLPSTFQLEVREANRMLESVWAQLMPTAMHPWMDPAAETVLWAKEDADIYQTFDRIFDCRRHGWSNIQSMHINLPFADDAQFARLHAAVRLLLPLLPALAASSPIAEGRDTGVLDYRIEAYRANARSVPSVAGKIIPETVVDGADYQERILDPMYREIARYDKDGVLC